MQGRKRNGKRNCSLLGCFYEVYATWSFIKRFVIIRTFQVRVVDHHLLYFELPWVALRDKCLSFYPLWPEGLLWRDKEASFSDQRCMIWHDQKRIDQPKSEFVNSLTKTPLYFTTWMQTPSLLWRGSQHVQWRCINHLSSDDFLPSWICDCFQVLTTVSHFCRFAWCHRTPLFSMTNILPQRSCLWQTNCQTRVTELRSVSITLCWTETTF